MTTKFDWYKLCILRRNDVTIVVFLKSRSNVDACCWKSLRDGKEGTATSPTDG